MPHLQTDVVIIGAGVAGLWLGAALHKRAQHKHIILESTALAAGQTIAAQGIIHGGVKYALTSQAANASKAIADMPERWANALHHKNQINNNNNEPDLSKVKVLSTAQLLWTTASLTSRITTAVATKALRTPGRKLPPENWPAILAQSQQSKHRITVYEVAETVIDPASLTQALANLNTNSPIIHTSPATQPHFTIDQNSNTATLHTTTIDNQPLTITATTFIFTAGDGNEQLAKAWTEAQAANNLPTTTDPTTIMQRRPLHMTMVREPHPNSNTILPLFGHQLTQANIPAITITTQTDNQNRNVWAIGGQPAEQGNTRNQQDQINAAKQAVQTALPWINLTGTQWTTKHWTRAEGKTPTGNRPDTPVIRTLGNLANSTAIAAWPTKLAFAPKLSDDLITHINQHQPIKIPNHQHQSLPSPPIAKLPHDEDSLRWTTF